jgi:hypothetical protein
MRCIVLCTTVLYNNTILDDNVLYCNTLLLLPFIVQTFSCGLSSRGKRIKYFYFKQSRIKDGPYLTSMENILELTELSSTNKVSLTFSQTTHYLSRSLRKIHRRLPLAGVHFMNNFSWMAS